MKQLRELYEYREMIFSLVKKDLRGRYKGSVLGFLWTFINPLLQLVVFTLVFSVIMKAGYEQYYMFLFVALVPWMFFASSVQDGSTSILREKDMVKKIYFPREVLPIATVTSGFVNMLLTFIVIFAALLVSGRKVQFLGLACLPVVMIVEYILCLGIPDWAMPIFRLNPMTPVIEIYRDILYYGNVPQMSSLLLALFIGIVFIIVGELLFKKLQKGFAENF